MIEVTQENANYLAARSGFNVEVNHEHTHFIVRHDPNLEPLCFAPEEEDTLGGLLKFILVTTSALSLAGDSDQETSLRARVEKLESEVAEIKRKIRSVGWGPG